MLIQNGGLFQNGQWVQKDLRIEGEEILSVADQLTPMAEELVIDAKGKKVVPSFTDLHVHFRDPGFCDKEDIFTGSLAAAHGGFTRVCTMPNVKPVPDTPESFQKMQEHNALSAIEIDQYAPITKGLSSSSIVEMEQFLPSHPIAFTNDGVGVQDAYTMEQAMKQAHALNKTIVAHVEDESFLHHGSFHKGTEHTRLNDAGIPSISEYLQLLRDLALVAKTGCAYHMCHISTKESVALMRKAKAYGLPVTCEVTPHHLLLNDTDIPEVNSNYKMNPPLRSREDQAALWEGLLDGTIDCIATDHAPHTKEEKARSIENAPFGITGLELAFPLLYTYAVKENRLSLEQLLSFFLEKPAQVFDLPTFAIEEGKKANLTIIDLETPFEVTEDFFLSKGVNSPFIGQTLYGKIEYTLCKGEVVYEPTMSC